MDRSIYIKMAEVEDRHWWFVARRQIIQCRMENNNDSCLSLPFRASLLAVLKPVQ